MDYSATRLVTKMALVWRAAALVLLVSWVAASPAASVDPQHSRNSIQTGDDLMDSIYSDCLNKGSVSCVKYKLFSFVDKVSLHKQYRPNMFKYYQLQLNRYITLGNVPKAIIISLKKIKGTRRNLDSNSNKIISTITFNFSFLKLFKFN